MHPRQRPRIATIVKALRVVFDTPEMKQEFERWSTRPTLLEGAELGD